MFDSPSFSVAAQIKNPLASQVHMANGPTLPPQAYTREILTSAFNWLQLQPESVKKLATTPDALVGLYLRAQRYGSSSLETDAPISQQVFLSDLKSLAEGLKQFDEPSVRPTRPASPQAAASTSSAAASPSHSQSPSHSPSPSPSPSHSAFAAPSSTSAAFAGGFFSEPPPLTFATTYPSSLTSATSGTAGVLPSLPSSLNERSRQMIQETRNSLNLSSDAEVINLMVALAYKNLKNLLA